MLPWAVNSALHPARSTLLFPHHALPAPSELPSARSVAAPTLGTALSSLCSAVYPVSSQRSAIRPFAKSFVSRFAVHFVRNSFIYRFYAFAWGWGASALRDPALTSDRFASRAFSSTYKPLFLQVLCLYIYTKPRGVAGCYGFLATRHSSLPLHSLPCPYPSIRGLSRAT
jgi:hypothetical protein